MNRYAIGGLSLSAAAFVALLATEYYTSNAVIPTKNDRPTVGFGSTFRDDGSPVKLGDTITPTQAVIRSYNHILKSESALKRCVTTPVNQVEFDLLTDFTYQYGVSATCKSSIVKNINNHKYREACEAYTLYKFSGGYDCSIPNNKVCAGVWKRNLERRDKCIAAQ